MPSIIDPAREIVDLCELLQQAPPNIDGAKLLGTRFEVEPWSTDFFLIVAAINERFDGLKQIIEDLELDDDTRNESVAHLQALRTAFNLAGFTTQWQHTVQTYLAPVHVQSIKSLSPFVRMSYKSLKLSPAEVSDLLADVSELISELYGLQLKEQDFIRQALIDGLKAFCFRIKRLQWLGWGYTLESLQAVIGAYLALERGYPDLKEAPQAELILKKTLSTLRKVFETTKTVKEGVESTQFLLAAYGTAVAVAQGHQAVSGLLTFHGG